MMSRTIRLIILALAIYIGAYLIFRQTHIVLVEERHQPAHYVIFPEGYGVALYYLWRPLLYGDATVTATRFHAGPYR